MFYDGNCTSLVSTTEILTNLCGNKGSCDVIPTIETFSDPCPYVPKVIRAWYQCVGDGIFIQILNFKHTKLYKTELKYILPVEMQTERLVDSHSNTMVYYTISVLMRMRKILTIKNGVVQMKIQLPLWNGEIVHVYFLRDIECIKLN